MSYQFGHVDPDERTRMEQMDPIGDDQYDPAPPRRRGGLATGVAFAIMAVFSGGLWFAYNAGKHHTAATGDDIPTIRADAGPTKVKPDQPGGMEINDRDKYLYNEKPGGPGIEKLLPSAEQPVPRAATASPPAAAPSPTPSLQSVPPASGLQSTVPTPQPLAAPLSTTPSAKPLIPPAADSGTRVPASAAAPKREVTTALTPPKPAVASLPPATKTPPAAKAGGIRIQIGAMRTEELAKHEWERLKKANSDVLGTLSAVSVRADLGEKGVFYRIQAGPLGDSAAAEHVCSQLKQRNVGCMIAR